MEAYGYRDSSTYKVWFAWWHANWHDSRKWPKNQWGRYYRRSFLNLGAFCTMVVASYPCRRWSIRGHGMPGRYGEASTSREGLWTWQYASIVVVRSYVQHTMCMCRCGTTHSDGLLAGHKKGLYPPTHMQMMQSISKMESLRLDMEELPEGATYS